MTFNNWDAVLILDPKKERRVKITDAAILYREHGKGDLINVSLAGVGLLKQTVNLNVYFSDYIRTDEKKAYCFHQWCCSILVWSLGGCSNSLLYKLGRTFEDAYVWPGHHKDEDEFHSETSLQNLIANRSSLSPELQPFFLSRLPLELRSLIWSYIPTTAAYSAFMLVAGETAKLARHVLSGPTSLDLQLKQGLHLSAKMISAFNKEYIQSISVEEAPMIGVEIPGDLIEINFVRTHGGICALKFVGKYGGKIGESDWLGKVPIEGCNWYGELNVQKQGDGSYDSLQLKYNVSSHSRRNFSP
jgi:hypothetical protein